MKSFQAVVILAIMSCACAFVPSTPVVSKMNNAVVMKVSPQPQQESKPTMEQKNAAAIAAFATAMAPFAAHATDVDEGTIIGYGAGLVACVVSLAVGFAIGYGTLVKP